MPNSLTPTERAERRKRIRALAAENWRNTPPETRALVELLDAGDPELWAELEADMLKDGSDAQ